ncbi:hypothetical protein KVR01_011688 [Diaporthe batatas]|uniref:uncharacterized protein n=1 Tax=Diaporthe batatas TaxID=748121 RepID=UPI001D04BB59|nr:uncharacterized protein KVR01_011688 [Diaporthe batatas]KAG8158566.1 hypothetical protein KVR01_011688 [Diaporthe batatas]
MSNDGYEEIWSTAPSGQAVHCCLPLTHPDRQIRVLVLDPVDSESPRSDEILQGRIDVLDELTDGQEYAALSYVWNLTTDPPIPPRENRLIIRCGDHQHQARIKPNCWSALWHLCKIRRPSITVLWVDSICIDQKNDEEMKQQISMMCKIYNSAQKTYFWVGEAGTGTDKAMEFLSSDRITSGTGGSGSAFPIGFKIWWQFTRLKASAYNNDLQQIFTREWITRLWTLQEFLLSREGILVCGEKSVSWKRLVCALHSIHYFHKHPGSLFFDSSHLRWLNLVNLAQWFAQNSWILVYRASEDFNQSQVEAHLNCLKWSVKNAWLIYVLCTSFLCSLYMYSIVFLLNSSPLVVLFVKFALLYLILFLLVSVPGVVFWRVWKGKLFFPRNSPSILEELRNRQVSDPKDIYNGTVGILGGGASTSGESLCVLYRKLCTSLMSKTQSLDVLLFANTYANRSYPSWIINWESEISHVWGNALSYSEAKFSVYLSYLQSLFRAEETLGKYRGVMPARQARWDFRDQGQSLSVFGLVLTHISSHLTPTTYADAVTPLHLFRWNLLSIKAWVNYTSAKASRLLQKSFFCFSRYVAESPVEMIRPQYTIPTTGTTLSQIERRRFISLMHAEYTRMTTRDRKRAAKQLMALMTVAAGNRLLERELMMWWKTLSEAADTIYYGDEWIEKKVLSDERVENSFNAVMHILQEAKLGAVGYETSEVLDGFSRGLAFAAAGAQTGDAVALVSGMAFPLVLRPCGEGRFRLVGPIFLPGAMDGELEDQITRMTLDEIIIV